MLFATVKEAYNYVDHHQRFCCSGCGGHLYLSHSHLIPRSEYKALEAETDNIRFHCMSFGNHVGCHDKIGTMQFVFLNDFIEIMLYIFKVRPQYFWQRFFKLQEYWKNQPIEKNALPMHLLMELDRLVTTPGTL